MYKEINYMYRCIWYRRLHEKHVPYSTVKYRRSHSKKRRLAKQRIKRLIRIYHTEGLQCDVKPLCEPKVSRMEPDFVWTHEKPIVCDSTSSGPLRRSGVIVYPGFVS